MISSPFITLTIHLTTHSFLPPSLFLFLFRLSLFTSSVPPFFPCTPLPFTHDLPPFTPTHPPPLITSIDALPSLPLLRSSLHSLTHSLSLSLFLLSTFLPSAAPFHHCPLPPPHSTSLHCLPLLLPSTPSSLPPSTPCFLSLLLPLASTPSLHFLPFSLFYPLPPSQLPLLPAPPFPPSLYHLFSLSTLPPFPPFIPCLSQLPSSLPTFLPSIHSPLLPSYSNPFPPFISGLTIHAHSPTPFLPLSSLYLFPPFIPCLSPLPPSLPLSLPSSLFPISIPYLPPLPPSRYPFRPSAISTLFSLISQSTSLMYTVYLLIYM